MKKTIKKWLGITEVEKSIIGIFETIGKESDKPTRSPWDLWGLYTLYGTDNSLREQIKRLKDDNNKLRADFQELDNKFDKLEQFLQVEYFKTDEKVQVYDWAEEKHTEGFRKTKPYEEVKNIKEVQGLPPKTDDCCDDD